VSLRKWDSEHPADAVDLTQVGAHVGLLERYGGAQPAVLAEILTQAYNLGAQSAVIEYRYIDPDYRNEHARFYSTTFRRYPSVAHRLHFFAQPIPAELSSADHAARFADRGYLGYTVVRPIPAAPVGRTMLAPPAHLARYVTSLVPDTVNLLGESLTVRAAPFVAQDAQLAVCAHATLWMIGYYHHLSVGAPRLLPGQISDAVPAGIGRGTPSIGLTRYQMSAAANALGFPALVYGLRPPPPGESLQRLACRYLNSGLPVIVGGAGHAFVLVGYQRHGVGEGERIHFIRHDDEVGPYQLVENFQFDDYAPWHLLLAPLPPKVYLAGEDAEVIGQAYVLQALEDGDDVGCRAIVAGYRGEPRTVSFQAAVLQSNKFKLDLERRGVPDTLAGIYRRMPMSRWIWVVEAVDRELRNAEQPCVLAEAILDATDHIRDVRALAWRVPGLVMRWNPDTDTNLRTDLEPVPLLDTVARVVR